VATPLSSPVRSFYETLKAIKGVSRFSYFYHGDFSNYNSVRLRGPTTSRTSLCYQNIPNVLGFTEGDLRGALATIGTEAAEIERVLGVMRSFYSGYCFRGSSETLYNPTQSLFFLDKYHRNDLAANNLPFREFVAAIARNEIERDEAICELQDENVKG